jgi:nitrite reductase/ring-hydroxylating ferredoxin subunit
VPAGDPTPPRPGRDPGQAPLRPGRDPGGRLAYLPPRAARARKLILRTQLGRGWIVASALFGVVILVAGALFLARGGRPGPPWVRVAPLSALPAGAVTQVAGPAGQVVVVDRRHGELRAFLAPPAPCAVQAAGDGFARPCTSHRWTATGAPTGGTGAGPEAPPRLRPVPVSLADGDLYVDPR